MIPYIMNTVLSCFFIYIGTCTKARHKKINIWVILAILIPSILAGARDVTIGTDTSIYGVPFFTYALNTNFENFMATANGDLLWLLFVYGLTQITTNVFWELFLIEFIILFFTYNAMKQYNLGKYTWIGFFVFHLMFYSFTLNLMRQFICLSILLYSFKYIKECKLKRYILICIILFFIQKTSIIGVFLYPIYHLISVYNQENSFFQKLKIPYKRFIFKSIIIIGAVFILLFANQWIIFFANLFDKFQFQVEHMHGGYNIIWRNLIYMFPLLLIMLLFEKSVKKYEPDFEFFSVLMIIYIILWQLQGVSRETYRIGFYFGYFMVISIPILIKNLKLVYNQIAVMGFVSCIMIIFYIDYFVIHLYNETYPYTSLLLGIE